MPVLRGKRRRRAVAAAALAATTLALVGCTASAKPQAGASFTFPDQTDAFTDVPTLAVPSDTIPAYDPATDTSLPTEADTPEKPPTITYRITGNGSHSSTITYVQDGDIEQDTNAHLPWKKTVDGNGSFFSVSAQDDDGTSITCTITDQDGTVLDKKTAHGQYAIASCQNG